jgi:hypothetical protein
VLNTHKRPHSTALDGKRSHAGGALLLGSSHSTGGLSKQNHSKQSGEEDKGPQGDTKGPVHFFPEDCWLEVALPSDSICLLESCSKESRRRPRHVRTWAKPGEQEPGKEKPTWQESRVQGQDEAVGHRPAMRQR